MADTTEQPGQNLIPVYTSYMWARVDGEITRLTFGDGVPGVYDPVFHNAFVVKTEIAVQFANLILDLVQKNKENTAQPAATPHGG
jgi:hypothetical protein